MAIRVEFFGIARSRAGVAETTAEAETLADLFIELGRRFQQLEATCFHAGTLNPGFIVNLNGERFASEPSTRLQSGDTVLLLSADAGG